MTKNPKAHIFGPYDSHDQNWLYANRAALEKIHAAIGKLLNGEGTKDPEGVEVTGVGLWASDGEGYTLMILMDEDKDNWNNAGLPYTADYMRDPENDNFPHEFITGDTYRAENERGVQELGKSWEPEDD